MPVCQVCTPEEYHIGQNIVYIKKILPQDICSKFGLQLLISLYKLYLLPNL